MPENSGQAEQGSDVNLISSSLVDRLGIKRRLIHDLGIRSLYILTSTGETTRVEEFVVFNVGVQGIWRSLSTIVRPPTLGVGKDDTQLLLGLSWLFDVNALIDVRRSALRIGDPQTKSIVVI